MLESSDKGFKAAMRKKILQLQTCLKQMRKLSLSKEIEGIKKNQVEN